MGKKSERILELEEKVLVLRDMYSSTYQMYIGVSEENRNLLLEQVNETEELKNLLLLYIEERNELKEKAKVKENPRTRIWFTESKDESNTITIHLLLDYGNNIWRHSFKLTDEEFSKGSNCKQYSKDANDKNVCDKTLEKQNINKTHE